MILIYTLPLFADGHSGTGCFDQTVRHCVNIVLNYYLSPQVKKKKRKGYQAEPNKGLYLPFPVMSLLKTEIVRAGYNLGEPILCPKLLLIKPKRNVE